MKSKELFKTEDGYRVVEVEFHNPPSWGGDAQRINIIDPDGRNMGIVYSSLESAKAHIPRLREIKAAQSLTEDDWNTIVNALYVCMAQSETQLVDDYEFIHSGFLDKVDDLLTKLGK